jgi:hypothetical protein
MCLFVIIPAFFYNSYLKGEYTMPAYEIIYLAFSLTLIILKALDILPIHGLIAIAPLAVYVIAVWTLVEINHFMGKRPDRQDKPL